MTRLSRPGGKHTRASAHSPRTWLFSSEVGHLRRADRASGEARFEELYRSTAKDLLAYLTRRASDPEEATDLLAEVYVIACQRLDKVPPDGNARLWLFGVARTLLMKDAQAERSHQALMGA
jgi:DNA-directed RNA polymerase specialized sigma24 family protein